MERFDRLPVLSAVLAVLAALVLAAHPAVAAVFMSQQQALAEAFPGARLERRALALDEEQVRAVQERAQAKLASRLQVAYLAWRGDTLAGTAFFDRRTVRTMPGVFMVVVAPDTTLARVDVLAFHEPPDYRPTARWLGLFARRRLDPGLWPQRDIRNLSGATLSARAVTESARLALALYERLVAPTLSRPRGRGEAR